MIHRSTSTWPRACWPSTMWTMPKRCDWPATPSMFWDLRRWRTVERSLPCDECLSRRRRSIYSSVLQRSCISVTLNGNSGREKSKPKPKEPKSAREWRISSVWKQQIWSKVYSNLASRSVRNSFLLLSSFVVHLGGQWLREQRSKQGSSDQFHRCAIQSRNYLYLDQWNHPLPVLLRSTTACSVG